MGAAHLTESQTMPVVSVRIPQLGEGLQEALLIEFLKKPGDEIKRDEPIYVMETDKAVTEVESPYCLLYTSPSPRDLSTSRMPSSA